MKCKSCGKLFKGHEITLTISNTCLCGFKDFELKKNFGRVYRLDIIKYLPLSGEYMVIMSELSPWGREAFRKIVKILKHKKRGIVKTVSLVVKVHEKGRWVRKRVKIDAKDESNYEKIIRKKYGSNARIELLQFHRKKLAIINGKHVQTALALAYVKLAEKFILKIFDHILNQVLNNRKKLKIYQQALEAAIEISSKKETDRDKRVIREEWVNKMLTAPHLMDNQGFMDEKLELDLEEREKLEKICFDIPRTLILWDIFKYYLSTSFDRRSKYSVPFPKLRPNLDINQLKVFEDFDPFIVKILKDYRKEKIEYITNIREVLAKKFEIENQMRGFNVKLKHPAVGAAIINMKGKLSLEESAFLFSVNPVEVQKEKEKIETFGKPTSKKAKKFLEMIKG